MKLDENGYWAKNNYKPCWELSKCSGILPNGDGCPAFNAGFDLPCWQVAGTKCKGKTGRDTVACVNCVVYRRYGNGDPMSPMYNVRGNPVGEIIEPLNPNRVGLGRKIGRVVAFVAGLAAIGAALLLIDPNLLHLDRLRPDFPVGVGFVVAGLALCIVPIIGSAKDRKSRLEIEEINSSLSVALARAGEGALGSRNAKKKLESSGGNDPLENAEEQTYKDDSLIIGASEAVFRPGGLQDLSCLVGVIDSAGTMADPDIADATTVNQPESFPVEQPPQHFVWGVNPSVETAPDAATMGGDMGEEVRGTNENEIEEEHMSNDEDGLLPGLEGQVSDTHPPDDSLVAEDLEAALQTANRSLSSSGKPVTFADIVDLFGLMTQAAATDTKLAANLSSDYSSVASSSAGLAEDAAMLADKAAKAMAALQDVFSLAQEVSKTAGALSVNADTVSKTMEEAAHLRFRLTTDAADAAVTASKHVHVMSENLKRLVAGMGFGEGM